MNNLFFLISYLSDAFFVFVTLALIVEGSLGLCQIKNYRLRAFFRLIPCIALSFLPLLQHFHIGQFLNPLGCSGWFQKSVIYFFPGLKSYLDIPKETILEHVFFIEPFTSIIKALLGIFIVTTVVIFLSKIFQMMKRRSYILLVLKFPMDRLFIQRKERYIAMQL